MSWDIWVIAAKTPPPPLAETPDDWQSDPMGSAIEVRQKISNCLGEVDWSDPTWGRIHSDGVSLEFNLGDDDPCLSFMIHVRGSGDAIRLLERLIPNCGWYLCDCSQGEWVHHCDDANAGWTGFQAYRERALGSLESSHQALVGSPWEAESPRELTKTVWKHVLLENSVLPLLLVALGWSFYISAAVFHFDIVNFLKRRDPQPIRELIPSTFWIAILFTVIGAAFGAYNTWRALRLAQFGVEVVARVTDLGTFASYGQIRVYYEFTLHDQVARKVMSCTREEAQQYQDGVKQLVVMCDPWRPRKSMLKTEVLPDSTPSTE